MILDGLNIGRQREDVHKIDNERESRICFWSITTRRRSSERASEQVSWKNINMFDKFFFKYFSNKSIFNDKISEQNKEKETHAKQKVKL